jgi:hypothetical protein
MKTLIAKTLTVVSLAVLLLAGSAYGQYVQHIIKVKAPFDFTVSGRSFAAGEYSIVCFAPNRIDLRDAQQRVIASLITYSVDSQASSPTTELEFSTANGGHVLTRIWVANDRVSYALPVTKVKTLVAKGASQSVHTSGAGNK